ncbi:MAG: hypothetical protein JWN64_236 [Parcubacteria group bacterium]|nr:hypothetical protein [Parcubacteria group bacterium]
MPKVRKIEDRGPGSMMLPLRVTTRAGRPIKRGKQLPRHLVRCGCCDQRLEVYFDDEQTGNLHSDTLEINGVIASIDQWRQFFGPFLGFDEKNDVIRALLEHYVRGSPTMNLEASKGDRVVFALLERHGGESDREHALRHLTFGETYTVNRMRVGGASSDVYLDEFPNIPFNTVLFLDAPTRQ